MVRLIRGIGLLAIAGIAPAQTTFDAASVKLTDESARRVAVTGGPGTKDPGRVTIENLSLKALVSKAYDVKYYQVFGPDWTEGVHFDIVAKIPEGATKKQFQQMLQNLLADRLKLVVHRDKKDMPLYALQIGKNGSKLKPAAPDPLVPEVTPSDDGPPQIRKDKNGYPLLPPGVSMASTGDRARFQAHREKMTWLVEMLSGQLNSLLVDETGLSGEYDFTMYWGHKSPSTEASIDVPDLFSAVQEQLGLKLESRKGPVDVIVIDSAARAPTAN